MVTRGLPTLHLEGKPLLPTHPARARKLLDSGKATVYQVVPFTIQLVRVVENPVGSFTVGIDDGVKKVGIAVVNEHTQEVVFAGTIKLRQDVPYFQERRFLRGQGANALHAIASVATGAKSRSSRPTIVQKKESIVRVVVDLKKGLFSPRVWSPPLVIPSFALNLIQKEEIQSFAQNDKYLKVYWTTLWAKRAKKSVESGRHAR